MNNFLVAGLMLFGPFFIMFLLERAGLVSGETITKIGKAITSGGLKIVCKK